MPSSFDNIGDYEIVKRPGKGGMGDMCLAEDPAIGRLVVIKLLRAGRRHRVLLLTL